MKITKENIKTLIIVLLAVILAAAILFGTRAINKYRAKEEASKDSILVLNTRIDLRNKVIVIQEKDIQKKDMVIDSLKKIFRAKDAVIAQTQADLNKALAQLNSISSDSSYVFLQKVAYNYPGTLQYLFNALQLRYIHGDYLIARSSESTIPLLRSQIQNAKDQFVVRDSIESGLKKVVELQKLNLADCQKISDNKDSIIKDKDKAITKAERRKTFWKLTTGGAGIIAVLAIIGIL